MNKIKSEQSGRSMVEMLGVLAIIGVLSVGGIAGYSKAMAKFKLSKAMDQISTIVANVRTLYSSQPSYSDLTTEVAIRIGAIPTEMLNGQSATTATAIYNAYNGPVYVENAALFTQSYQTFVIGFGGLGKEACVALLTADWGRESGSGFVAAGAGSYKSIKPAALGAVIKQSGKKEITLSDAATQCSGTGDTNFVALEFY